MPWNGEVVAVETFVGSADTSDKTAANRSLIERTANAAIGYLVAYQDMNQQTDADRWVA